MVRLCPLIQQHCYYTDFYSSVIYVMYMLRNDSLMGFIFVLLQIFTTLFEFQLLVIWISRKTAAVFDLLFSLDPCIFLKLFQFIRTRPDNQATHADWILLDLQVTHTHTCIHTLSIPSQSLLKVVVNVCFGTLQKGCWQCCWIIEMNTFENELQPINFSLIFNLIFSIQIALSAWTKTCCCQSTWGYSIYSICQRFGHAFSFNGFLYFFIIFYTVD